MMPNGYPQPPQQQQQPQTQGPGGWNQQPQQGWGQQAQQGQQPQQQLPQFNPTDPNFLAMPLEYDAEIDANEALPTVYPSELVFGTPDPGYRVHADFASGWKSGYTKDKKPYISADLMLTILECAKAPAMIGRKMKFTVSTAVWQSGTSSAQQIIQAAGLGETLKSRAKTPGTLQEFVAHIVNQKIQFNATVDWEASFYDKNMLNPDGTKGGDLIPRIRGYKAFETDRQTGLPIPEITRELRGMGNVTKRAFPSVRLITKSTNAPQAAAAPVLDFSQSPMVQVQPQFQQPAQPQFAQQSPNLGVQPQGQSQFAQPAQQFQQGPQAVQQPQQQFQQPTQQTFQQPQQQQAPNPGMFAQQPVQQVQQGPHAVQQQPLPFVAGAAPVGDPNAAAAPNPSMPMAAPIANIFGPRT